MAFYNISKNGARVAGASTANDWSVTDTWNIANAEAAMKAAIEAGNDNVVVFDDDVYTLANQLAATSHNSNNHLFVRPRFKEFTLEIAADDTRLWQFNHASNSPKYTISNMRFRRAKGFSWKTGTFQGSLIIFQGTVQVTMNDCICDRIQADIIDASGRFGAMMNITDAGTRSITLNNLTQLNTEINQQRFAGTTAGGIVAGINVDSAAAGVSVVLNARKVDGIKFFAQDLRLGGIDEFSAGNITIQGRCHYKNIDKKILGPGTTFSSDGTLSLKTTGAISQSNDSIVIFENIVHDEPAGQCFGLFVDQAFNLPGVFVGKKCRSKSAANSVGGLFLGLTVAAQGNVGFIIADECDAPFGPAFYVSNGAGATVKGIIANKCRTTNGIVYKGGGGSADVDVVVVCNSGYYTENEFQVASNKAAAVYGHMHPTTSTQNGHFNIGVLVLSNNSGLMYDEGSTFVDKALLMLANDNATYSITQTIGKFVSYEGVPDSLLIKVLNDGGGGATQTITETLKLPRDVIRGVIG